MSNTVFYLRKNVPKHKWLPSSLWNQFLKTMPIACVDLVLEREDNAILYGWRLIKPYSQVWALPGGRILHGETVTQSARRIAREYGLRFNELCLIGVFPQRFRDRSDISIATACLRISGEPKIDGIEFSRFAWMKTPPSRLGENYRRMISKWKKARKSDAFRMLNRLQ